MNRTLQPEPGAAGEERQEGAPAAAESGASPGRSRPRKAPTAFRTISEVAEDLHVPQHVLRFWETKFPQVRPLKRAGGRRYYRPADVALLQRIATLLYVHGYTIKGVQRLLRESEGMEEGHTGEAPASEATPAPRPQPSLPLVEGEKGAAPETQPAPAAEPPRALGGAPPVSPAPALAELPLEAQAPSSRRLLAEVLVELKRLRALLAAGGR